MSFSTIKNILAVLGMIFIAVIVYARISGGTARWNREVGTDDKHSFNVAYIDLGEASMRRIEIISWSDFEVSDHIQVTTASGETFLTGASRIVLVSEPNAGK